jgi:MFS family permease
LRTRAQTPVERPPSGSTIAAGSAIERRRVSLWRQADFLKLWGGETTSQLGSQVTLLALPLTAIITLRASPQQVGVLTAALFAPYLIVTLFAGQWLDTHRRRPALLLTNAGRFVVLGLIPLLYVLGGLTIALLCVLAFLAGTFSAVFDVAYLVYLPSLVERDQLVDANAKLEATYSIAQVGGPGLGGLLVQAFTAPMAILADSVSYGLAIASVAWIRRPEPEPARIGVPGSLLSEIKVGLEKTLGHPVLLPLTLQSAWFNLFEQATLMLTLLYAVRSLHLDPGLLGAILAVGSLGGLVGTVIASRMGRLLGVGRTLVISILLGSAGLVVVPLAAGGRTAIVAILVSGFAVYGFGTAVFNVHSLSLRIAMSPPEALARVTATYRFVVYGTVPLGGLFGGFLGGALGLRAALFVVVAALVAAPVAFAFTRVRTVVDLDDSAGSVSPS